MNPPRSRWPSLGFVAVCLTYTLVLGFFCWGLARPDLDRFWTIQHALKAGQVMRLGAEDRTILQRTFARYPDLAHAILEGGEMGLLSANGDGWLEAPLGVLLRTPESGKRALLFEVQTPEDLLPFTLIVRGSSFNRRLTVAQQGLLRFDLPEPPPTPEIVEVRLKGRRFRKDPSMLGFRVTFP